MTYSLRHIHRGPHEVYYDYDQEEIWRFQKELG